jgi:hypothetical protein
MFFLLILLLQRVSSAVVRSLTPNIVAMALRVSSRRAACSSFRPGRPPCLRVNIFLCLDIIVLGELKQMELLFVCCCCIDDPLSSSSDIHHQYHHIKRMPMVVDVVFVFVRMGGDSSSRVDGFIDSRNIQYGQLCVGAHRMVQERCVQSNLKRAQWYLFDGCAAAAAAAAVAKIGVICLGFLQNHAGRKVMLMMLGVDTAGAATTIFCARIFSGCHCRRRISLILWMWTRIIITTTSNCTRDTIHNTKRVDYRRGAFQGITSANSSPNQGIDESRLSDGNVANQGILLWAGLTK